MLPYLWLGFVPAMQPVWLRHLTGMFRDCCTNAQDLDLRAALASMLVDVGIVGAAALLVTGGAGVARRIVASSRKTRSSDGVMRTSRTL